MKLRLWVDALGAGAATGLIAEVLVLRMNPEVTQTMRGVLVGMPLWASWGMLMVGVPLLVGLAVFERFRPKEGRWLAPQLFTAVFFIAAVLTAVNAKLHALLLSGPAHRVLVQDSVGWGIATILVVAGGSAIRRSGDIRRWRVVFSVVMVVLPVVRLVTSPTPPRQYLEVEAQPLGVPNRQLLVIGLEGLDAKVLLADAVSASYPHLARLREDGVRAPLTPHRPYLRWALWTSVATGTYPGRHGVKAHRGWDLPLVFSDTLRLLPWTPEGSRMILPWGLSKQVPPPPATVAPLWSRLRASDVATEVIGWPGSWGDDPSLQPETSDEVGGGLEPSMRSSLEAALEPFPERRSRIWSAIVRDQTRVELAIDALEAGVGNIWIHLETLSMARRYHEPLRPRHTRERLFLELVMELVDDQLGDLLGATDGQTLVAVVSPFGLAPPGSFERMKRLFGGGESWHTSAEGSPDGLFILLGGGVDPGRRVPPIDPPDVAPTLCYLLGLPVAQYMEGSVVINAVTPSFLAENPLRVID
jgi:microcompartment protein CcmK/EutM